MILRPKTVSQSNNVLKNTNHFHLLLSSLVCAWIIYVKTGKTLESWEVTLMSLDRSWLPLSENLDHHPPKKTNRSARSIWRYRFSAGVWNCQILNQVVESQLFTYLWNRYHQWLSDIELIQLRVFFSASYSRINTRFTAGKRIGVWNCHATRGHRETTNFTSIGLRRMAAHVASGKKGKWYVYI